MRIYIVISMTLFCFGLQALDLFISASSKSAPSWKSSTQSHYGCSGGHCFSGTSKGAATEAEAKEKATADAFTKISRFLNVEVKSVDKIHEEVANGVTTQYISSTAELIGATVAIDSFDEDVYTEKWERNGNIEFDGFVKIKVPEKEMNKLTVKRDALTAWGVEKENSCRITNELETFITETGSKKGWKMTPRPIHAKLEDLFEKPTYAYYFLLKPSCNSKNINGKFQIKAEIVFNHFILTGNSVANTFSATGIGENEIEDEAIREALTNAKNSMSSQLFGYSGKMFSPQMPDIPLYNGISNTDTSVLKAYDKAIRYDKDGWLFTGKTIAAWEELANFIENNPYIETARKRIELWEKYGEKKKLMDQKITEDRKKLIEIMPLAAVGLKEKTNLLKQYLYNYLAVYGVEQLFDIINQIENKNDRIAIYSELFSKGIQAEWEANCERNSGAACYFLGSFINRKIVAQNELEKEKSKKLLKGYLSRACNADIRDCLQ